jgi:Mn2+/Fe2+ NRAMP family transporter
MYGTHSAGAPMGNLTLTNTPDGSDALGNPVVIAGADTVLLAVGILGATVMPHNLYLHSSIVQTRKYLDNFDSKKEAIRFATIDSRLPS